MERITPKWHRRFLDMANFVASWSRDPSTQVGAVIARPDKTVASVGFNGLPKGLEDTNERLDNRDTKYELTVHAEINAMAFAKEPLIGYTLYTSPLAPCIRCAGVIIQNGISKVVYPQNAFSQYGQWSDSCWKAYSVLEEAGVEIVVVSV